MIERYQSLQHHQDKARSPEHNERRYRMMRRNLWEMLIFLMVSICAYAGKDFNLFGMASEPVRQILGYPPPAYLVSLALAVYCFSSATLTLTAMARDARPEQKWSQLGYRIAFFAFYSFSGAISANFIPVLCGGICLYALEHCHIWFYTTRVVAQEKNLLEKF